MISAAQLQAFAARGVVTAGLAVNTTNDPTAAAAVNRVETIIITDSPCGWPVAV